MNTGLLKRISSIDFLHLVYLVILCLLTLVSATKNKYFNQALSLYCLLLGVLILLINFREKIQNKRLYHWIFSVYPAIYVFIIFESLSLLLPALNPRTYDHLFINIDYFLLKHHPTVWLERLTQPWLTEVMFIFYSCYFIMPLILVLMINFHKRIKNLEKVYFVMAFSFYASYLCYLLLPASGPRFHLAHLQTKSLEGIYIANFLRNLFDSLELNKMDAFPSVHQLMTLIVTILSYRYERKLFYIYLPIFFGVSISLVYCRYHYVTDLIAGTFLALLFLPIAFRILRKYRHLFGSHFEKAILISGRTLYRDTLIVDMS